MAELTSTFEFTLFPRHVLEIRARSGTAGSKSRVRMQVSRFGDMAIIHEDTCDVDNAPINLDADPLLFRRIVLTNELIAHPTSHGRFAVPQATWSGDTGYGWNLAIADAEAGPYGEADDAVADVNLKFIGPMHT